MDDEKPSVVYGLLSIVSAIKTKTPPDTLCVACGVCW
jgi:hypothetical protein